MQSFHIIFVFSVMKELRPIISYNDLETKWKNPTTMVHLACPSCHSYKTIWQLLDNFIMINRYPSRNIPNLPSEDSCGEQLTSKQSFYLLTISIKGSIKNVWHSSKLYASAYAGHLLWTPLHMPDICCDHLLENLALKFWGGEAIFWMTLTFHNL